MKINTLVTHNGQFHADEVMAVALLSLFNIIDLNTINIVRTRDMSIISQADIVLDVGGVYEPEKLRFDHHQLRKGTISSAGFVWKWIKESIVETYTEIDRLISEIDAQDCGIKPMAKFSFSHVISTLNSDELFDDEGQSSAFLHAVGVALSMVGMLKTEQDQYVMAKKVIARHQIEKIGLNRVIILEEYCPSWKMVVHGESTYAQVTHIIWYLEQKKQWVVQVPATKPGEFKLAHPAMKPDVNALFVHANGFLAIYDKKSDLLSMLSSQTE